MSSSEKQVVDLNFRDYNYLKSFIEEHKDEQFPLTGTNSKGELVIISAVADNVDVAVCQANGYMMHHTYYLDRTIEEWFEH